MPGGPLRFRGSGAHGRGAAAVVGFDVDEPDHALLDLPRALQSRANVLGVFDIFGVAAQSLGHLVVARVSEVAARLVASRIGGPLAVEADHAQQGQFVPDRGVELHRVLPEGVIAMQADDPPPFPSGGGLGRGLAALAPTANGNPTPIVPKGPELSRWSGDEDRARLAAKN